MKVLSIKQPWAWLIVNGYKDIENRIWQTKFRGQFYIHAGKQVDIKGYEWALENVSRCLPLLSSFKTGGIVEQTTLVDCITASASHFFFGPYGFVLKNSIELPFIECKGKLRFFEEPKCRICGCTSYNACPGSCYWIETDRCSKCEGSDET